VNTKNHGIFGWKSVVLGLAAMLLLCASPAAAVEVYFNDFEGLQPYPEWGAGTQATTPSGRHFLGTDPNLGFSNEAVTLTLTGLPLSEVTVSFDLYIINSWEGDGGPDSWSLAVNGGPTLLWTTFSNVEGVRQSYPDNVWDSNPPQTGAAENDTLGYGNAAFDDSVYKLTFTFAHNSSDLSLSFSAGGLSDISDESWGLDNVRVSVEPTVVPLPSAPLLLGVGLVRLALWKRRC
jgi:hypothetical protein